MIYRAERLKVKLSPCSTSTPDSSASPKKDLSKSPTEDSSKSGETLNPSHGATTEMSEGIEISDLNRTFSQCIS